MSNTKGETAMDAEYDPNFVKWIVGSGTNFLGPFNTEAEANGWITGTHSEGCTVYPLLPGMIS